jgi:hypothetical protein
VDRWEAVPFLPTQAFKAARLVVGNEERAARVFRTSGTTSGPEKRGEHWVRDLSLYRASLLPNFKAYLLPEGAGAVGSGETSVGSEGPDSLARYGASRSKRTADKLRILSLLPTPSHAPDSSLSFMMGEVTEVFGDAESDFFVDAEGALASGRFREALERARDSRGPVLVAGTAFSFVRWIDVAEARGWQISLPPGSRIMETGGYKGRSRELPRSELYAGLEATFGVAASRIVNEYGMTELLSQFYEPVLAVGVGAGDKAIGPCGEKLANRFHRGPPWVGTMILDPLSLSPLSDGEVGILAHFDLANIGSVAAVLTEDLGRKVEGGFELLGRRAGSEPRGCSLAMEDFLSSRGGSPS